MNAQLYKKVYARYGETCQACFEKDAEGVTVRPRELHVGIENLDNYTEEELTLLCNTCTFRILNYLNALKDIEIKKRMRRHRMPLEERRKRSLENLDSLRRETIPTVSDTMKGKGKGKEPTRARRK